MKIFKKLHRIKVNKSQKKFGKYFSWEKNHFFRAKNLSVNTWRSGPDICSLICAYLLEIQLANIGLEALKLSSLVQKLSQVYARDPLQILSWNWFQCELCLKIHFVPWHELSFEWKKKCITTMNDFEISFLWKHQCFCFHYWEYLKNIWQNNWPSIFDEVEGLD